MIVREAEFETLDEYEPRFSPVSYTRQELIDEAQTLADDAMASWLAKQPNHVSTKSWQQWDRRSGMGTNITHRWFKRSATHGAIATPG
jgi:hypothetical protein